MKIKIVSILAIGLLLLSSCDKEKDNIQSGKTTLHRNINSMADGEDDTFPIHHKVTDIKGSPQFGATVTIINGSDTSTAITDSNGQCKTYATHFGTWNVSVVQAGFLPFNKQIQVIDSVTSVIDTLQMP